MADEASNVVRPGGALRVAREVRGISLEEAARQTCIGISYLRALEADRYEELPNPAYVKGILRSYARILGISPEPLIDGYTQVLEPAEQEKEGSGVRSVPLDLKTRFLLLFIGFMVCAGYLLAQRDTGRELPSVSGEQMMATALPPQVVLPPRTSHPRPVSFPVAPAAVSSLEEDLAESAAAPLPSKSVLKAKILAECQLTMTIDDMPSQQYDLKPGDQVEWIGERYFALEMTNAGAVQVGLNGKRLPSLGKGEEAVSVVITADGRIQ